MIGRFMNNEFPYIHVEVDGTTSEYYYAESADRNKKHRTGMVKIKGSKWMEINNVCVGREYLPPDLRQRFDEFELLGSKHIV